MRSKMLISFFFAFAMTHTIPLVLAAPSNDPDSDSDDEVEDARSKIVNQLASGSGGRSSMMSEMPDQLSKQSLSNAANGRNALQAQAQKAQRLAGTGAAGVAGMGRAAGAAGVGGVGRVAGMANGALRGQQDLRGRRMQAAAAGSRGRASAMSNIQADDNDTTNPAQPNGNNLADVGQQMSQLPASTLANASNLAGNIPSKKLLNSKLPSTAQIDANNNLLDGLDEFKDMSQSLALPNIVSAASTELPLQVANRVQQQLQLAARLLSQFVPGLGQALSVLSFTIANPQLMQTLNNAFMEGYDGAQEITNLGIGSFFDITEGVLGIAFGTAGSLIETSADGIGVVTKPAKRFAAFAGGTATRATDNIPFLGNAIRSGSGFTYNALDIVDDIGSNSWRNFGTDLRTRGRQGVVNGDARNEERFQQRSRRGQGSRSSGSSRFNRANMNQEIPTY